jgi:hypothetical protein
MSTTSDNCNVKYNGIINDSKIFDKEFEKFGVIIFLYCAMKPIDIKM